MHIIVWDGSMRMIHRLLRPVSTIFSEMNATRRELRRGSAEDPKTLLMRSFVLNVAVMGLCVVAVLLLILVTGIVRAFLGRP